MDFVHLIVTYKSSSKGLAPKNYTLFNDLVLQKEKKKDIFFYGWNFADQLDLLDKGGRVEIITHRDYSHPERIQ